MNTLNCSPDRAVTFTNWAGDQPGMIGGLEDCCLLEFSDTGLWHDYPCEGLLFLSQNHGWICEYREYMLGSSTHFIISDTLFQFVTLDF